MMDLYEHTGIKALSKIGQRRLYDHLIITRVSAEAAGLPALWKLRADAARKLERHQRADPVEERMPGG